MSQSGADEHLHKELIDQFVEITGVDRDRARFYIETAGFDLPIALSGYYEGGFEDDLIEQQPDVTVYERIAGAEDEDVQIIGGDSFEEEQLANKSKEIPVDSTKTGDMSGSGKKDQEKKKFATLFPTGGAAAGPESSSDDDDDRKGQAFYVGGSEKSGQQVLGPPKKKGENLVDKFFQQARERGAEQVDPSQRAAASGSTSSRSTFSGAGYRLGDTVRPSEKIGGQAVDDDVQPITVTVNMRMWRNGFTIDDGPLRTFDDPKNREFLEHIMQGRLPPELIQAHRGKQIDLDMEDHRQEEYKPPKQTVKAFAGQGHMLGSPIPEVVGAGKIGEKPGSADTGINGASAAPAELPPVDESKPVTNIQIRLGNGDRLVMKLNHDNTVRDLREFICRARPDIANRPFILMTNFPNKELTNEAATLEESNLLNAVIIQRFK